METIETSGTYKEEWELRKINIHLTSLCEWMAKQKRLWVVQSKVILYNKRKGSLGEPRSPTSRSDAAHNKRKRHIVGFDADK